LFYLAPVGCEVAPILVLELLHRIADTFKVYFGPGDATENKLRKNFAICFQLLEEVSLKKSYSKNLPLLLIFIFTYELLTHLLLPTTHRYWTTVTPLLLVKTR
jgi:hypothetical protein